MRVPTAKAFSADGEVVWSWRLDAGVKSVEAIPSATETKKPELRGEHEVAVKTIAQGRPDESVQTCGDYTRVLF